MFVLSIHYMHPILYQTRFVIFLHQINRYNIDELTNYDDHNY